MLSLSRLFASWQSTNDRPDLYHWALYEDRSMQQPDMACVCVRPWNINTRTTANTATPNR